MADQIEYEITESAVMEQGRIEPVPISPFLQPHSANHSPGIAQQSALVPHQPETTQPSERSLSPPSKVEANVLSASITRLDFFFSPVDDNDPSEVYGQGWVQTIILLCCQLAGFVYVCHYASIILLAPDVDHWCSPPLDYANMSDSEWKRTNIPLDERGHYHRCLRYEPPMSTSVANRTEMECSSWTYDEETYGQNIVSEWDLVCDRAWLVSMLSAVFMVGSAVSVPISAHLSGKVGRRPVICMFVVVLLLSGSAECFAKKLFLFALLRFVVAAAASSVQMTSLIVMFELCTASYKARYNLAAVIGLGAGVTFIELLRLYNPSRFWTHVMVMIPTACLLSNFYLMVESPKWLLATWRVRQAERVVMNIAQRNGMYEFDSRRRWSDIKRTLCQHEDRLTYMAKTNFKDLLHSKRLRIPSLTFFTCSFVTLFAMYAFVVSLGMEHSAARVVSVVIQFPLAFLCYKVIHVKGRNLTLTFSLCLCAASCCFLTVFQEDPLYGILFNIARGAAASATLTVYFSSVEGFPAVIRNVGACAGYAFGRLGAVGSPFMRELAYFTHPTAPYALISVLLAVCSVFAVRLPTSKFTKSSDSVHELDEETKRKMLLDLPQQEIGKSSIRWSMASNQ